MKPTQEADFKIMHLTKERLANLRPVTVLDTYENGTTNFHEEGLFSSSIFGRIGDPNRDARFSYIDCKIKVLHPLIFRNITKIKRFYQDIIRGAAYATFDRKINDFAMSNQIDGETGYNFFLSHWDELNIQTNDSKQRNERIRFIDKYKKIALTDKILVMPAGLRDIEAGDDGRDVEGEVNEYYRRILSISNTLNSATNLDSSITDSARLSIQNAFNDIYNYIINLCSGKGGFILKKWAQRKVFNSTRSVLTTQVANIKRLDDNTYPGWNSTTIGIAQLIKAILPVASHFLVTHPLYTESFPTNDNTAYLIDPKTLERVQVKLDNKVADKWTTQAGIESLFDNFMEHSLRSRVIEIEGHYLGLIYKDSKDGFRLFFDIKDAEQYNWVDKKNLHPITWIEFFYLMGYKEWNKYPGLNTRYPISGAGSIYPSYAFVKTTVDSEVRYELDNEGKSIKEDKAISFPVLKNPVFVDSLSVSLSRLPGMGGDFDGDTTSFIAVYTQDSLDEISGYLNSAAAYINPQGGLLNSPYTDPVVRVITNMTGD